MTWNIIKLGCTSSALIYKNFFRNIRVHYSFVEIVASAFYTWNFRENSKMENSMLVIFWSNIYFVHLEKSWFSVFFSWVKRVKKCTNQLFNSTFLGIMYRENKTFCKNYYICYLLWNFEKKLLKLIVQCRM